MESSSHKKGASPGGCCGTAGQAEAGDWHPLQSTTSSLGYSHWFSSLLKSLHWPEAGHGAQVALPLPPRGRPEVRMQLGLSGSHSAPPWHLWPLEEWHSSWHCSLRYSGFQRTKEFFLKLQQIKTVGQNRILKMQFSFYKTGTLKTIYFIWK